MEYQYTTRDLIDEKENYMYSFFNGRPFMSAYMNNRLKYTTQMHNKFNSIKEIEKAIVHELNNFYKHNDVSESHNNHENISTLDFLLDISQLFRSKKIENAAEKLDVLVHRFEVSKKIHPYYDKAIRVGSGGDRNYSLYLLMGLVLIYSYITTDHLQYLSTLLKVLDVIISVDPELRFDDDELALLEILVLAEVNLVVRLETEPC